MTKQDKQDKDPHKKQVEKSHTTSDKRSDETTVRGSNPDTSYVSGVSLLFVSLDRVRARFAATLYPDPPTRRAWINALAASARDVPLLVAELERLRTRYADLVAACRAGLIARHDGQPDDEAWQYIQEELPPAPPGHPLHDPEHYEAPQESCTRRGGDRHD